MRSGVVPCSLLNRQSWVSSGRTQSGLRVVASVHSASFSEERKSYLGSSDTYVCLLRRVASRGMRGASQSVLVFSNTVLGAMAYGSVVLGSWSLSIVVSAGEAP